MIRARQWPRGVAVALTVAATVTYSGAVVAETSLRLPVSRVDVVGFTVADMERSVDFYTRVLTFRKISDTETSGRPFENSAQATISVAT